MVWVKFYRVVEYRWVNGMLKETTMKRAINTKREAKRIARIMKETSPHESAVYEVEKYWMA